MASQATLVITLEHLLNNFPEVCQQLQGGAIASVREKDAQLFLVFDRTTAECLNAKKVIKSRKKTKSTIIASPKNA